jgi:hypothetical protein
VKVTRIWSPNYKKCANCGTTRHPHKAKGFCKNCYPLQLTFQNSRGWDLSKPESLKGFPHAALPFINTPQRLEAFKLEFQNRIARRLYDLRLREEKLKAIITGIDIEHQLETIARKIVPRSRKIYHGVADLIDQNFNNKQKKIIYILLNKIHETLPWRGIRIGPNTARALVRAFIDSCGQQSSTSLPISSGTDR